MLICVVERHPGIVPQRRWERGRPTLLNRHGARMDRHAATRVDGRFEVELYVCRIGRSTGPRLVRVRWRRRSPTVGGLVDQGVAELGRALAQAGVWPRPGCARRRPRPHRVCGDQGGAGEVGVGQQFGKREQGSSTAGLDQILDSARARAGLAQATCRQLRHTCLTRLREAGSGPLSAHTTTQPDRPPVRRSSAPLTKARE